MHVMPSWFMQQKTEIIFLKNMTANWNVPGDYFEMMMRLRGVFQDVLKNRSNLSKSAFTIRVLYYWKVVFYVINCLKFLQAKPLKNSEAE